MDFLEKDISDYGLDGLRKLRTAGRILFPENEMTEVDAIIKELEAFDWYNQHVHICKDPELKKILIHNRDEEKEHAAMTLEWIRKKDPIMDKELKEYLFTGDTTEK